MTRIAVIDTETTGDTDTDQVIELAVVTLEGEPVPQTCPHCGTERDPLITNCPTYHGFTGAGYCPIFADGQEPWELTSLNGGPPSPWWRIASAWSTLVRPTVPVHPAARAAHHITDAELAAAPTAGEVWETCQHQDWGGHMAAHNAPFDWRMMRQTLGCVPAPPERTIDTYRCARHLWPDAPTYSNGGLRYWLPGLDEEARVAPPAGTPGVYFDDYPYYRHPMAIPPHRALPDAWVTAHILLRMLREHSPEHLAHLSTAPLLLRTFPMGPHRGKPLGEVPLETLRWALTLTDVDADLRHTCEAELARPDRPPVMLDTCFLKMYRGKPWTDCRTDYLEWVLRQADFDADVRHTCLTVLEARRAAAASPLALEPAAGQPGS
jgi:exodeoxyribonuclease X